MACEVGAGKRPRCLEIRRRAAANGSTGAGILSKISALDRDKPQHALAKPGRKRVERRLKRSELPAAVKPRQDSRLKR